MSDYLQEIERIARHRETFHNRIDEDRAELYELRDRLRRLHDVDPTDPIRTVFAAFAGMLDREIIERCPHDPTTYVIEESWRSNYRGRLHITNRITCLQCGAYKLESHDQ